MSRSQVQEPQVIFLDPEPNDPPQPADAEPEVLVLPEPRRMTMGRRRVMDLGLIALLLSGPRR